MLFPVQVWVHFGTDLDPKTVVHAWLTRAALVNATNKGYRAIWSVDGLYYLDALNEKWTSFYDVDILEGVTNKTAIPLILGGETCMWGETADVSQPSVVQCDSVWLPLHPSACRSHIYAPDRDIHTSSLTSHSLCRALTSSRRSGPAPPRQRSVSGRTRS